MNKLSFICLASASLASAFFAGRWTAPQTTLAPAVVYEQPAASPPAPTALTQTAPAQQPALATGTLPSQPSYQRDWLQMQGLIELAKTAPEAALEQTRQLKGELQQDAQNQILALWGQSNPALAWRWLENNDPANNSAFIALIGAIAITQPTATLDLADRFAQSQSPIKKDIYQAALQGLARGGHYDSAVFLLDYLDQNDGFRQDLTRSLVDQWATYQPQSALEWLAQQPVQPTETPPGRAGTMPSETPLEDAQQQHHQLLENTYRQWLEDDAIAAASWLGNQIPSPALDRLSAQLVQQLADNPTQALAAAGRIQDPQLKLNSLLNLLSPIKQTDRIASASGGIEGPNIVYNGGYYYLFVSKGTCCAGANSTYYIAYGRSTSLMGPYLDKNGVDMKNGGGTVFEGASSGWAASGGQSVASGRIARHRYSSSNGASILFISDLNFSGGWPTF